VNVNPRIDAISIEMCRLLDEQSALLKSGKKLIEMSGEQTEAYAEKNQRLRELCKQLSEMV
jgi:hypothetical protein